MPNNETLPCIPSGADDSQSLSKCHYSKRTSDLLNSKLLQKIDVYDISLNLGRNNVQFWFFTKQELTIKMQLGQRTLVHTTPFSFDNRLQVVRLDNCTQMLENIRTCCETYVVKLKGGWPFKETSHKAQGSACMHKLDILLKIPQCTCPFRLVLFWLISCISKNIKPFINLFSSCSSSFYSCPWHAPGTKHSCCFHKVWSGA